MATTLTKNGCRAKPLTALENVNYTVNCGAITDSWIIYSMHTLYDSETYSVTHMLANAVAADIPPDSLDAGQQLLIVPQLIRHGFEIVDKRSGKEVYLDGSWAELFQQHISAWQLKTPSQEEVENTLEQYAELAQNPVVMH